MNLFLKEKILYYIPDKIYLKYQYKKKCNKKLNLKNPITFNDKLQWLKLYDRKDIYITMVDKYKAKEYVANIIGNEYIIPTLGVYDKFEDINFDKLPNQFVIKCTHDSGGLVIVRDKSTINKNEIKFKIEKSLKNNFYYSFREWPYKKVKPRIIIEKYMKDDKQEKLIDYKFFCFNGEPKFIYISQGLENHNTAQLDFVDFDFKRMPFKRNDYKHFNIIPNKPINFDKMLIFAKRLSKDIPFLRVDFYEINGKLYFGELTFFPNAGYMIVEPDEWNIKLGEMINIPNNERNKNEK